MPNVSSPAGARPVMHRNGTAYNGTFRTYSSAVGYNTALYIGDFVKLTGASQTLGGRVLSDVDLATATSTILGAIVGFKPVTQDSLRYRAAATLREVFVADDPDLIFEMQENTETALTANDAGLNIEFEAGAGSTATGLSGNLLDNSTAQTTNTLGLHLIAPVAREDNEIGAHAKWLVSINQHQFTDQSAGV